MNSLSIEAQNTDSGYFSFEFKINFLLSLNFFSDGFLKSKTHGKASD